MARRCVEQRCEDRRAMIAFSLALLGLGIVLDETPSSRFVVETIAADSDFEASGVGDIDKDGDLDIVCGDRWYAAPDWKPHGIAKIEKRDGYRLDFSNVLMDIDGDGYLDIVSCNWHEASVLWRQNPGKDVSTSDTWATHVIDKPGNMETAIAVDVDGDGKLDFLPDVAQKTVWYRVENGTLVPHEISATVGGHGIGFGDVNGDGRSDVLKPTGWFEAPTDRIHGEWKLHAEWSLGAVGIGILVNDFNGDGLSDVFTALGHDYGTFWLEQSKSEPKWIRHDIDKDWSQGHALRLVDLDGDRQMEVLTGKRKYAHETDPGAEDDLVVFSYAFDRSKSTFRRDTIVRGKSVGLGLEPTIVDIDRDGDLDIVAPGKSGLYCLIAKSQDSTKPAKVGGS